jgi:hypothetical protein
MAKGKYKDYGRSRVYEPKRKKERTLSSKVKTYKSK